MSPAPPLNTCLTVSERSFSSPRSSRGSAWTLSPSRCAGLVSPTPFLPVIHLHGMGKPWSASHCIPVGCWGTSPSGFSSSVTRDLTRRVPPHGWPVTVRSPCHPGWGVSQWRARVGAWDGGAEEAALCEGTRSSGRTDGRMWLASLSRRKRKKKEVKTPYWIL